MSKVPAIEQRVGNRQEILIILDYLSVVFGVYQASARLGIRNLSRGKPCPIHLTLKNKVVHYIIHKAKGLERNPYLKHISISFDRTPCQIKLINNIKSEMQQKADNDEKLKIGYRKGIPKLVPLN